MKKSVLKVWESKESILKLGNHGVSIKPRPLPVRIISDKTLESESFDATRVFYYFDYPVCVVNDEQKTFRLSHAGVYATDKATGETIEGVWPKTTTQTLMMYRDLACGEEYTEVEPIEGRPAIDWKAHMDEYNERKAMIKAGIIPPRKTRAKKAKINDAMLELLEREFGLSRDAILAKMNTPTAPTADQPTTSNLPMCIPVPAAYAVNAEFIHDWFTNYKDDTDGEGYVFFNFEYEALPPHEYANTDWWETAIKAEQDEPAEPKPPYELQEVNSVIIDADYIDKLIEQDKKEKAEKSKKTAKKPAKKSTAKKTLGAKVEKNAKKVTVKKTATKKTSTKKTTKKEAVA